MRKLGMRRLFRAALITLGMAAGGAAWAQQAQAPAQPPAQAQSAPAAKPQTPPSAAAPEAPALSADTKADRAKLDSYKADLDQKERALEGRILSDADLQNVPSGSIREAGQVPYVGLQAVSRRRLRLQPFAQRRSAGVRLPARGPLPELPDLFLELRGARRGHAFCVAQLRLPLAGRLAP